jgi:radical SAM superfamily enzyme YgiQ (UPF0313 family)/wyosine [tRNA(Phe)-imidazoG37] synthetase (radical SAM superfamily)
MSKGPNIQLVICPPFGPEMPPLSLACLAAAARQAGFSAGVMDLNIRVFREAGPDCADQWSMDYKTQWVWPTKIADTYSRFAQTLDRAVLELAEAGAEIYGFSCHSDNRLMTQEIIGRLKQKKPDAFVIVGGMGVYSETSMRQFDRGLVDAFVVGHEGEATLIELLQAHAEKRSLEKIPGVMAPDLMGYDDFVVRETSRSLDEFPWPTFEDFDLTLYTTKNLPILASRGCKGKCLFCNDRVLMGPHRFRMAENVFEEIRHHVLKNNIKDFSFNDLQINYNIEQIDRLCTMINEWGESIHWTANAIVSEALEPSILKNLRAAGCHTITLGIESGSERIMKGMNKGFSKDTVRGLMRDMREADITLWINLVIGFPGETDESVAETIAFIEDSAHLINEVCVCNSCNILDYSILANKKEKFGIAASDDPDWFEVSWETTDGANTPAIRNAWLGSVLETLKKKNVPVRQTNHHFHGESEYWADRKLDAVLAILPPFDTASPPASLVMSSAFMQAEELAVSCMDFNLETHLAAQQQHEAFWDLSQRDEWADPEVCAGRMEMLGLDAQKTADRLLARDADNIAFFVHRANTLTTLTVLKAIGQKSPGKRTILFGPSTSIAAERDLFTDEFCNYMVIGETEQSLCELVLRLKAGGKLSSLRGVRYTTSGGDKHYLPREPNMRLDSMPLPDYRELRPEKYGPVLKIRTSRGCRWRCAFCAQQPLEGPARYRSPKAVFDEIEIAYRRHDIRAFEFDDLVSNGNPALLETLCELLIEAKMPIRFGADFAPSEELKPLLFEKLHEAGCKFLRFGVESFSDDVLRLMNKSYTSRIAMQNLKDAHAAGLETHINIIVGFPGERPEDFYITARAIKQVEGFVDFVDTVSACEVLPKSAVERNSQKYIVLMPPVDHSRQWSHKGWNNEAWRNTRVKEMAVWIAGMDLKFNYDFFLKPGDPLRHYEKRIRRRIAKKTGKDIECVLVNLPPWGFTNPPLGSAILASYLDHHGHPAKVLDFNARWYDEAPADWKLLWHVENKNFWSSDETWPILAHAFAKKISAAAEEILKVGAAVIGISVCDPKERLAIELVKQIRNNNQDVVIILGGPAIFTPEYRRIFFERVGDLVDGYVVGEGEEALQEIVETSVAGGSLKGIPGVITLMENGEPDYTPRESVKDLDSIPYPTYEHFDMNLFSGDSLVLEWSRGCISDCAYCKGKNLAGTYRSRSARHIFEEIKHHVDTLGYKSFTVSDNILNGRPKMLEELCDMITGAKLSIHWNAEAAPMKNLSRALLTKLKAAGCFELQLGVETGSERVLEMMNKSRLFSIESAARVLRDAHEVGIKTCMFCMVGYPGETEEDFQKTLNFIEDNASWIDQVKSINSCHIITGTDLHKNAKELGITLPEIDYHYLWVDTNGLDHAERNDRIRRALALVQSLEIECLETNLTEGKQLDLLPALKDDNLSMDEKFTKLLGLANQIGSFDSGEYGKSGKDICVPDNAEEGLDEITAPPDQETVDDDFVKNNLPLAGILSGDKVFAGPDILELDLTNRCNLHCAGCWNHGYEMGEDRWTGEISQRTLPTDIALGAIDQAADAGAKMVQLSGAGEPLLHPDFLKIVRRIKSRGLKCTVITNGALLKEKHIKEFVKIGLDNLTVSAWAGTPEMYAAVHPKTKGKTLIGIRDTLIRLHELKREKGRNRPHVKIYNVINRLNAGGIDDMITFALRCRADHVEFTPIDIVAGKSDHLALRDIDRETIKTELDGLVRRNDYLELDPTQSPKDKDNTGEGKEFARFVKHEILPKDFRYELDDITKFDVLCARKEWRLDIREDNVEENALFFGYPKEECQKCPLLKKCSIDSEHFHIRVEFLSVLGFGAFYRRITSVAAASGAYDKDIIRDLPCNIGWTYVRIGTDGAVLPCCKGKRMPMGNLNEKDLLTIWTSQPYAEFRDKAMNCPKDDPYFHSIECLKACDNLGMILKTTETLDKLSDDQKQALLNIEKSGVDER